MHQVMRAQFNDPEITTGGMRVLLALLSRVPDMADATVQAQSLDMLVAVQSTTLQRVLLRSVIA